MNTKQIHLEKFSSSLSEMQFEPQKMNKLESLQIIQNDMSPSMIRMDCHEAQFYTILEDKIQPHMDNQQMMFSQGATSGFQMISSSQSNRGSCLEKRQSKQHSKETFAPIEHTPQPLKKSGRNETEDKIGQILLGKRRRGRKQATFDTYQQETGSTIDNLKDQIKEAE